jgi:hypothetical protein
MTDETFFVAGFGTGTADELAAHIAQLRIERDAAIGDNERAHRTIQARLPNTLAIDYLFAALEPAIDAKVTEAMDKVIEARVEAALAEFRLALCAAVWEKVGAAYPAAKQGVLI